MLIVLLSFVYLWAAWAMDFSLGSTVLADIEHQLRLTMDVTAKVSVLIDSDSTTASRAQKLVFSPNTWIERGNDIWIKFHLRWDRLSGGPECVGPSLLEALGGALRNSELWTHLRFQLSLSIEDQSSGSQQHGRGSIILRLQQSLGAESDPSQTATNRRQQLSRDVPDIKAPHGVPCVRLYAIEVSMDLSLMVGHSNSECIDRTYRPQCGSFEDLVGLASALREDAENMVCQSNTLECDLFTRTSSPEDEILELAPVNEVMHSPTFEPLFSVDDLQQAQCCDESSFNHKTDEDEVLSDYNEADNLMDDFLLFSGTQQSEVPPEFSEDRPELVILDYEPDISFEMLLEDDITAANTDQTPLPSKLLDVPDVPRHSLKIINTAIGLLMAGETRKIPPEVSIESNDLPTNLISFAPSVFSLEYQKAMKSKLHLLPAIARSICNIERRSTKSALQERPKRSGTMALGSIERILSQSRTIQSCPASWLRDSIELSLWGLLEHDLRANLK